MPARCALRATRRDEDRAPGHEARLRCRSERAAGLRHSLPTRSSKALEMNADAWNQLADRSRALVHQASRLMGVLTHRRPARRPACSRRSPPRPRWRSAALLAEMAARRAELAAHVRTHPALRHRAGRLAPQRRRRQPARAALPDGAAAAGRAGGHVVPARGGAVDQRIGARAGHPPRSRRPRRPAAPVDSRSRKASRAEAASRPQAHPSDREARITSEPIRAPPRGAATGGSVGANNLSDRHEQRSLFGEILDWMLAPLLLLWPMSVALTWLVAQGIANRPYDRELGQLAHSVAREMRADPAFDRGLAGRHDLRLAEPTAALLRSDDVDRVWYQVRSAQGELVGGDAELAPPLEERAAGRRGAVPRRHRAQRPGARRLPVGGHAGGRQQRRRGAGGRDLRQALAPGHRDHQGRDPAAVRDPAAGGAAGVVRAGARHRAAQHAAAAHPPPREPGPEPDRRARRARGGGAAGALHQRPARRASTRRWARRSTSSPTPRTR